MNLVLWLTPILVPLIVGVVLTLRPGRGTSWLLAAAPAPALLLAMTGPVLPAPELPWLLLEPRLGLDDISRVLLGLTALVWIVAGVYARTEAEQRGGYADWWLLSLSGNVGLLLSDDILTFYTAFVVMTLAAYGLVVHSRTVEARRAGRVYLVLGVAGETLLLAGLLLAAADATGLRMAEIAVAITDSPNRDLITGLLIAGFGIKVGVIGLHIWLPLAHPAAPFAASAVLSGAMIKAGLVGWLRLLPIGEVALPGWSQLLVALGLATAGLGVVLGLTQRTPKVVLAYSSVSQMGFITLLVGVALAAPEVAPVAAAAAAIYALHHGVAKAALFLAVGLLPRAGTGWRRTALLFGVVVAGLALAGAPVSSGAFAKAWMKQAIDLALPGTTLTTLASLAAVGTTVLMVRLLLLLRAAVPDTAAAAGAGPGLAPFATLVAATLLAVPLVTPVLFPALATPGARSLVVEALWPVALGLLLAAAAVLVQRRMSLHIPEVWPGDLVVIAERAIAGTARGLAAAVPPLTTTLARTSSALQVTTLALGRRDEGLDRLEDRLTRWRTGGAMVALVALAVTASLLLPAR
jgi:formate hydrogenlyase subunit 3/multisubunit Na+/H+ antiporter MnhD subunit